MLEACRCSKKEDSVKQENRKDFDKEAAAWDQNPGRVRLANDVADAMIREAGLARNMDVLDFGCGTGLVTLRLQPFVRTVTGADSSRGMLAVLEKKIETQRRAGTRTQFVDLERGERATGSYDLIVSSMTLHHVPDPGALFRDWRRVLKENGRVCFADLDSEDGSFHSDNTGVFHFGFDRVKLKRLLEGSGFRDVRDTTAARVVRENEGKRPKIFTVFLITGRK